LTTGKRKRLRQQNVCLYEMIVVVVDTLKKRIERKRDRLDRIYK